MNNLKLEDINKNFPIHSQTSDRDKLLILKIIMIINQEKDTYNYAEIGSFLGGSLVPFILDPKCKKITSIDKRNRNQPDSRGKSLNYKGISAKDMLDNLEKNSLDIKKIYSIDKDMEEIDKEIINDIDLLLIDGEHTDYACFKDFINFYKYFNKDAICIFDDSWMVSKAIENILSYLRSIGIKHKYISFKNASLSIVFMGKFTNYFDLFINLKVDDIKLEPYKDQNEFFSKSFDRVIKQQLLNRHEVKTSFIGRILTSIVFRIINSKYSTLSKSKTVRAYSEKVFSK